MATPKEKGFTAVAVSAATHERLSALKLKFRQKYGLRAGITMEYVVSGLLDHYEDSESNDHV